MFLFIIKKTTCICEQHLQDLGDKLPFLSDVFNLRMVLQDPCLLNRWQNYTKKYVQIFFLFLSTLDLVSSNEGLGFWNVKPPVWNVILSRTRNYWR